MKRARGLSVVSIFAALAAGASVQSIAQRPSEIALTPEAAVEVALNRSPALKAARARARAEEAGARAEGRPENPKLAGAYKSGSGAGQTDVALTFDLWSLIGARSRRRAADAERERAEETLAEEAIAAAADAKSAVYAVQAASATLILRREYASAARAASALDGELAGVEVDRAEANLAAARSELARLLRVPLDSGWWTEAALAPPAADDPELAALAARATARRPARGAALAAARAAEQRARAWSASTAGALRLGAAAERQPDGRRYAGPAFELELPAFEASRPLLEAAKARADEAAARVEEEDAGLTAELETLRARLAAARTSARRWSESIVPARRELAAKTRLLSARRDEADARFELVETLRDYWTTRAALERAVGGSL